MVNVQEKLNRLRFKIDKNSHISIDKSKCVKCQSRACLFLCPAGLFLLLEAELFHNHEGCLECGTCYISCEQKAINWNYPRGGFGVCFRQS
ncbi:4Fe-4S ferredoxin iron-sulfur binding domain protein [Desulfofarcimen acetoxidans DSM 771]|uniref:4Fe-4S ferredoxin iron-sulfur binding domain protein n=1 Tax=Desulfofarcimen acetoxidans (strain ATCC 49208 / DSM 771 / KCTC 5769 / VKM B-1644 / 5575) TaxID=485916 RepID=C8VZJ7_DESAS|nr:4Fe-4S dicluster domain-containing protein [Desulfofarcimen acetoxidans]ACV64942.1 4Fe-4S ferredoxin iron-sulfur binding domain protein [Desulfofarcimen acetoxidans DSM 771]